MGAHCPPVGAPSPVFDTVRAQPPSPPQSSFCSITTEKRRAGSFAAAASALPCAPNPRGEGRLRGMYHHRCDIPLSPSQQHAPHPPPLPPRATRPESTPVAPPVILPARHHCWGVRGRGKGQAGQDTHMGAHCPPIGAPSPDCYPVCAYVPHSSFSAFPGFFPV